MSFPKIQYTAGKNQIETQCILLNEGSIVFCYAIQDPSGFFCHSRRGRKEIEGSDNIMTRLYSKRDLVTRKFLLGTSKKAE